LHRFRFRKTELNRVVSMSNGAIVVAGKLVVDEILWCDHPVTPGSSQRARDWTLTGGGQVWHTARAVARAGVACRVAGWAGDDADSDGLRQRLRAEGVDDRLVTAGQAVRSTVLVGPDGDRSIVSRAGAGFVDVTALTGKGCLDDAAALHIDAYALDEIGGDAVVALAEEARGRRVPISLEPTSERRLEPALPWLRRLPPLDCVIGRPDEVDATAAHLGQPPRARVLHDGAGPVRALQDGGDVSVAVPPADLQTTGAGDRFAAGWLVARAQGLDVRTALLAGIAAAQASAT
jgi:sugar/nucleoside kinase (ribokinase family)